MIVDTAIMQCHNGVTLAKKHGEEQKSCWSAQIEKIVDSRSASIPSSTEHGMIVRVRRHPCILDRLRIEGWAQRLGKKVCYTAHDLKRRCDLWGGFDGGGDTRSTLDRMSTLPLHRTTMLCPDAYTEMLNDNNN
jgi:hypothetical protein